MILAKCPTCGRAVEGATLADLPAFPFCCARCRTIDQSRWADGDYVVSRPLTEEDLAEVDAEADAPDGRPDESWPDRFPA